MLYTELLQLWDEAVQAVDVRDWTGALAKLEQITEPTSRTLFNTASAHVALGHLEPALKVSGPGSEGPWSQALKGSGSDLRLFLFSLQT